MLLDPTQSNLLCIEIITHASGRRCVGRVISGIYDYVCVSVCVSAL